MKAIIDDPEFARDGIISQERQLIEKYRITMKADPKYHFRYDLVGAGRIE